MNKWGIPDWLEQEVRERDKDCVYCGKKLCKSMTARGPRKNCATWEHIINDAKIITRENIALCCIACNASKSTKKLSDWMQSAYCRRKGIAEDTVAEIVKKALKTTKKNNEF